MKAKACKITENLYIYCTTSIYNILKKYIVNNMGLYAKKQKLYYSG